MTKPTLTKELFVDSIGAALKDGVKMAAELKQEENNMVFREELCLCNEKKVQVADNTQKACALMVNHHCSKVIRNRIKEQSDFETAVHDKPVKLLRRIKKMCAHQRG